MAFVRDNQQDYADQGIRGLQAWLKLGDVAIPPSWEVLEHAWVEENRTRQLDGKPSVSLLQYVDAFAEKYLPRSYQGLPGCGHPQLVLHEHDGYSPAGTVCRVCDSLDAWPRFDVGDD